MFDLDEHIRQWRCQLLASDKYLSSDLDELEAHLLDAIEDLVSEGSTEENAFRAALDRMGDVDTLNEEFGKVNTGLIWRRAMKNAIAVLVVLVKSLLLVVLLPSWIAIWVVDHKTNKGGEEFYQTAEKFRPAIPDLITPYMVEGLDIELAREISQEELGLDLEEALERLQEPDGGFWFNVVQGEVLTAISLRMTEKQMRWFWISIVIQIALIAVGYFADRKLKLPRYIEGQLEKIQAKIWKLVRRYAPLLMILLAVITIGIRISVARRVMRAHTFGHNQDIVLNDCLRIVAGARQWYRKPTNLGGGKGSWDGLSFDVLPVQPSTSNGSYAFTANEAVLTVTGTGVVQDYNGRMAHITSTYNAATDSLKSLVRPSMYY